MHTEKTVSNESHSPNIEADQSKSILRMREKTVVKPLMPAKKYVSHFRFKPGSKRTE